MHIYQSLHFHIDLKPIKICFRLKTVTKPNVTKPEYNSLFFCYHYQFSHCVIIKTCIFEYQKITTIPNKE